MTKSQKKSKARLKKYLVIALFLATFCSLIAQHTQAAQPSNYHQPDAGTAANPYLISNLANLRWLSEAPTDWWIDDTTPVHFQQNASINATETNLWNSGNGFKPIDERFIGVYDGGNFQINNLNITPNQDTPQPEGIGLFSEVTNSTLKNIRLTNLTIITPNLQNSRYLGGIVGKSMWLTMDNCQVSGEINVAQNIESIGGLIGHHGENDVYLEGGQIIIKNSTSTCNISVNEPQFITPSPYTLNFHNVGGIIGFIHIGEGQGLIYNCSYEGNINYFSNYDLFGVGGIVGNVMRLMSLIIDNCQSSGNIFASSENTIIYLSGFYGNPPIGSKSIGGISGYDFCNIIVNSFSSMDIIVYRYGGFWTIGGLSGQIGTWSAGGIGSIESCYYSGEIIAHSLGITDEYYDRIQVGGIVGLGNKVNLVKCFSTGNLFVDGGFKGYASGIIGPSLDITFSDSTSLSITNCYSLGDINVNAENSYASGISFDPALNCYSMGNITAIGEGDIGAYGISQDSPDYSYFTGKVTPFITTYGLNSFYDLDTTGISAFYMHTNMGYWIGVPTKLMKKASTFTTFDWDFVNTWDISPNINNGYPFLRDMPGPLWENYREQLINNTSKINKLQNYPNPFNPETTINFTLSLESILRIDIYNLKGQRIKTLIDDEQLSAGTYSITWNGINEQGQSVASGVYFTRVKTNNDTQVLKMLMMK